jgi:hypothetical protein
MQRRSERYVHGGDAGPTAVYAFRRSTAYAPRRLEGVSPAEAQAPAGAGRSIGAVRGASSPLREWRQEPLLNVVPDLPEPSRGQLHILDSYRSNARPPAA